MKRRKSTTRAFFDRIAHSLTLTLNPWKVPLKIPLLAGFLTCSFGTDAQDGSRITGFGTDGLTFTNIANHHIVGRTDLAEDIIELDNGNIVVGGWYRSGAGGNGWDWCLAGYNPTGVLDSTFGVNGFATISKWQSRAFSLALDNSSQQFYQGGWIDEGSSEPSRASIIRYHSNGMVDSSFAVNGEAQDSLIGVSRFHAVAVQGDGKVIGAGTGWSSYAVCRRYNVDGSLDAGFLADTLPAQSTFLDVTIDETDGSIIAVGTQNFPGNAPIACRYDSSGVLDSSFGGSGFIAFDPEPGVPNFDMTASSVAIDANGKILIAGAINNLNDVLLMRLNPNGTYDSTFNSTGVVIMNLDSVSLTHGQLPREGVDMVVQEDCRIVLVAGTNGSLSHILFRFLPDGTLDSSFGNGGIVFDDFPMGVNDGGIWRSGIISADGNLLVAGSGFEESSRYTDFLLSKYQLTNDFTIICESSISTSIDKTELPQNSIRAYPNPTSGELLMEFPAGEWEALTLIDALGREVLSADLSKAENQIRLGLTDQNSGIYFLQLSSSDGITITERIILKDQ